MTLLLDSHVLIWALHAPENLAAQARLCIENGANPVYFSSASIWELAIKAAKGLLELDEDLLDAIEEVGFLELPVRIAHAWHTKSLPEIHRDPFDRILVAQAQIEGLTLVTRDQFLSGYRVAILDA